MWPVGWRQNLFFFPFFFGNDEILTKKFWGGKMKKRSSHSAVIYTPGRWTGNNIFFKGGLIENQEMVMEKSLTFFPAKSMSTLCLQSRHYDVWFSHSVPLYPGPDRGLSRKPGRRGPEQGSLSILRSLLLISDVLYLPQPLPPTTTITLHPGRGTHTGFWYPLQNGLLELWL